MPTMDYDRLALLQADDSSLFTGEAVYSREQIASSGVGVGSGSLRMTYFTCGKTETITQVRLHTGSTAAGATPTICRIAVYQVDETTGDLSLVASTANDTALFAAASTEYTKAFSAPFTKYKGTRYAIGVLVVTAFALPNFCGQNSIPSAETSKAPRITGYSAQSDIVASITDASLTAGASRIYFALLP
jgi:hypothetical protein